MYTNKIEFMRKSPLRVFSYKEIKEICGWRRYEIVTKYGIKRYVARRSSYYFYFEFRDDLIRFCRNFRGVTSEKFLSEMKRTMKSNSYEFVVGG